MRNIIVNKRRLLDQDNPQGYLESDNDYMANNRDLCIAYLDRLVATQSYCNQKGANNKMTTTKNFNINYTDKLSTDLFLLKDKESPLIAYSFNKGAFIYLSDDLIDMENAFKSYGFSKELFEAMVLAKEAGCKYLLIKETPETKTSFNFDVSTGHISSKDMKTLQTTKDNILTCYHYEEGVFINVPDTINSPDLREFGYSKELIKLLTLAQEINCSYLQLDRDGEEYPKLRTFDW